MNNSKNYTEKYDCDPCAPIGKRALIHRLLDDLSEQTQILAEVVSELEKRTQSISTPSSIDCGPCSPPEEPCSTSNVANRIQTATERFSVQRQRIQDIIKNLEI